MVLAVRTDRDEPWHQKLFASMYYKLTQKFVLSNMPDGGFDTYLLDRQVIKTLQEFDEKDRDCIDESNACVKANGRRAKTAWKIPEFLLPSS